MKHEAIIGTTHDDEYYKDMVEWIRDGGPEISQKFLFSSVSFGGFRTIVLVPGGHESGHHDKVMEDFVTLMKHDNVTEREPIWAWHYCSFGDIIDPVKYMGNYDKSEIVVSYDLPVVDKL